MAPLLNTSGLIVLMLGSAAIVKYFVFNSANIERIGQW